MRARSLFIRRAACFLAVLALGSSLAAGCGAGTAGETAYSIVESGTVVGYETVTRREAGGVTTYSSSAVRPFLQSDASFARRFRVSGPGRRLSSYSATTRRNGVAFRTAIKSTAGGYEYLRDDLQTFAYEAGLEYGEDLLAFEPECAAAMQALLDGFLGHGGEGLKVVVPSMNMVLRDAGFERRGEGSANVKVAGVGEFTVDYEPSTGTVERFTGGRAGLAFERGRSRRLASKAFAPAGRVAVREVAVPAAGGVELKGSFYVPKAAPPYRVAVLVGDFGPGDRTSAGVLSQLAEKLALDGTAALACDRRGVGGSGGKYATYTLQTAVDDLNSEIDYLLLRSDVDAEKMFVVGYGEGGVAALHAAGSNPYVSACVLMATPSVRPFPDLALENVSGAYRDGTLSGIDAGVATAGIETLMEILGEVDGDFVEAMGRTLFLGWMRGYAGSDTLAAAAGVKAPVLVVQGGEDGRVDPEQALRLHEVLEARGGGVQEIEVFDGLGHGFGPEVGEAESAPYRSHYLVDEGVTRLVSGWLGER